MFCFVKNHFVLSGLTLIRDGDRQAAMVALMSCSVFACITTSSDLGSDELQGECTEAICPLPLFLCPSS